MLKLIQSESCFERHIVILLLLCLVDVIALFLNVNLPLSILYGPLLYLGFKSAVGSRPAYAYLHILPFLLFLFAYVLIHLGERLYVNWVQAFKQYYLVIYNIVLPISLSLYSAGLFFSYNKSNVVSPSKEKGVQKMYLISIFLILLSALLLIRVIWPEIGFDYSLIVCSFLVVIISIISYHLLLSIYQNSLDSTPKNIDRKYLYNGIGEEEFKIKLQTCLVETKLYLNADLTLDMLAEKVAIPKHHLSYFLNTYIGKSFYQLIAEYRIIHAKNRLNVDMFITIETLAYECGFNSKTTLNKYFKKSTGFAPSQYRSGIVTKQLSLKAI